MPSLVEEAREQAKGAGTDLKKTWNTVKVGKKNIVVEKQLPSPSQKNILASDIPTSSVLQKAPHKQKCALCTMWYEISSVNYKTPNYRLLELRREWGFDQTGRRYETASYLYANSEVCTFCSQFFDEKYHKSMAHDLETKEVPTSPIVRTELERTDVSLGCRTYQSSCVDNLESDFAISPPYLFGSKTRREVDPWWELSLEDSYHIHSISFRVMGGIQKALSVHVMVFKESVGFEDPFLESSKGKAISSREFIMPSRPSSTEEEFEWKLSPQTFGTVVRVQLQGVQPLHLRRIHIYQGDTVAQINDTESVAYEGEFTHPGAYATLSPGTIEYTLAFSPLRPRKSLKDVERERKGASPKKDVSSLFKLADQNSRKLKNWIRSAKESATWFSEDELISIREHIFDDIVKGSAGGTFVTERSRPNTRPGSRSREEDDGIPQYGYRDLISKCLSAQEPRLDFADLHQKLRQIMIQIDLKSNLKKLGAIGTSERFEYVAEDDELQLRRLQMSFDFVTETWDRIDAQRVIEAERNKKKMVNGVLVSDADVFPVERGCTWAQLCVILHMWCMKRARLIPARAFLETNFRDQDFFDPSCTRFDDDDEPKKKRGGSQSIEDMEASMESDVEMSTLELGELNLSLDACSTVSQNSESFPVGAEKDNGKLTLLGTVRSKSILPVLNTTFSEYKLLNLSKKVEQYPTFPKKLTADFGKLWVTPKASLVTKDDDQNEDFDADLKRLTKRKKEGPIEFDPHEIKALTSPFPDNKPDASKFFGGKKKGFFTRICSLCNRKYPKNSIRNFVILKHVITLRRSWDPAIIPKKMAMLEEGMGMYNLVPVCAYCSQYFDPDFEGGIAYPKRELEKGKLEIEDKIAEGGSGVKKPKVGFDNRYPIKDEFVTEIFTDERALKSRAGARKVREITTSLERNATQGEAEAILK